MPSFAVPNPSRRPRKQRTRPTDQRRRPVVVVVAAIVAILATITPAIVTLYTDIAWYRAISFGSVFATEMGVRIATGVVVGIVTAVAVWGAAQAAVSHRPAAMVDVSPQSPVQAYRQLVLRTSRWQRIALPLVIGIFAGFLGQSAWRDVLAFVHRQSFGYSDPQFHIDYGFYAFTLPLLGWLLSLLTMLSWLCLVINAVMHWLVGGIATGDPVSGRKARLTQAARVQLGVLAGIVLVVKAVDYWCDRYRLLSSDHEIFTGGSYTDINAILPARIVLFVIALVVAVACFSVIFLRDLRIPTLAVVLMLVSSAVISVAWPVIIENFNVAPNRAVKERSYIARNIESTRYSYGLTDATVTYEDNWGATTETANSTDSSSSGTDGSAGSTSTSDAAAASTTADATASNDASGSGSGDAAPTLTSQQLAASVANDSATISNIRVLDPQELSATFTQQQQLKNFYGFPSELNIDRYTQDGQLRDYIVAARELDPNALSGNQTDWINRHTVYTHGNGFVAAPANKVDEVARDAGSSRGGYPVYTVLDLQTGGQPSLTGPDALNVTVDQPRIYYGPVIASAGAASDYAIVGDDGSGNPREYDTDGSNFTYDGKGGVGIGNPITRAMYSARYQSMNLLLSDVVSKDSKIIYNRDPRDRVHKVAPWLTTDSVAYPVVIDGRIKWIVDGYTTVQNLPYSQHTQLSGATEDSQTADGTQRANAVDDRVAYIRNSVKAVVDAYDGTVDLYAFDESDPVLKVWQKAFPGTVQPASAISEELREHLRYPADLFKVQRELLTKYHVSDPAAFFTNDSFWSVPSDPTASETLKNKNQPPYYVVAADPTTKKASFQLITPLRGLKREFLAAHMSVSSDPDNYGKITVRVLPTNTQTQGPKQAQDTMMSSDQVSRDRTLWEGTNLLTNGNLLTLPVGDGGILYVEPIYSRRKDQASAFPKLLRVLTYYNGKVGYAPTVAEALAQVGIDPKATTSMTESGDNSSGATASASSSSSSGSSSAASSGSDASTTSDSAGTDGGSTSSNDGGSGSGGANSEAVQAAVARLDAAVAAVQAAQNSGSFEAYGKALDELSAALEAYHQATGS